MDPEAIGQPPPGNNTQGVGKTFIPSSMCSICEEELEDDGSCPNCSEGPDEPEDQEETTGGGSHPVAGSVHPVAGSTQAPAPQPPDPEEAPAEAAYEPILEAEDIVRDFDDRSYGDKQALNFDMKTVDTSIKIHETALVLDRWSKAQGEFIADDAYYAAYDACEAIGQAHGFNSPEFHQAMPDRDDPMFDPATRADLFSLCFEYEPRFAERTREPFRQQWMQSLAESPDFAALRQSCQFDEQLAAVASDSIAASYSAVVKDAGAAAVSGGAGAGAGQSGAPGAGASDYKRMASSASNAARQAAKEVTSAAEQMRAVGSTMLRDDVGLMFRRLKNNPQLKDVMTRAGKYMKLAKQKQRQRTKEALDDVDGIEMGGMIDRLTPAELAFLGDDDFGDDAMRRFAENQMQQMSFFGYRPKSNGPIIVVIDESGSMSGDRIANAKALALSMAWVSKNQKRYCALVAFSGGREGRICVLAPGKWDSNALVEWISAFDGGGTSPEVALKTIPERYFVEMGAPKGKTDMITITDGGMGVPKPMIDAFNEWKKREKVHHYGIFIDDSPGAFGETCDTIWQIKALSVEESCVAELVSI